MRSKRAKHEEEIGYGADACASCIKENTPHVRLLKTSALLLMQGANLEKMSRATWGQKSTKNVRRMGYTLFAG